MQNNIIEIKNLYYEVQGKILLDNISLSIEKNSFLAILGSNGAGKSTLLKTIAKIIHPKSGEIKINNININDYSQREFAKSVAYVPQIMNADYDFSALEIVMMGRLPFVDFFKDYSEEDYDICEDAMNKTGIFHLKDQSILSLSGGERQRVFISCALAQRPKVIILDEPISQLDLYNQILIMDLLKKINEDITIICVLHDINMAMNYSNKCIFMKDGRILIGGDTSQVLTKENIKNAIDIDIDFYEHDGKKFIGY